MLVGLSFLSPTNCFDALGDECGGPTEASPLKPESPDAEINEYLPKYELNYAEGSYSPPTSCLRSAAAARARGSGAAILLPRSTLLPRA